MCSSSHLSTRLLWAPFVVIVATQLMFIHHASSMNLTNTYLRHKCLVSQGIYKPGSAYEKNLNTLLSAIATINFRDGFMHTTEGKEPNSATLLFQCRGDSYWSKCGTCYNAAVSGLRRRCPKNKGGIIWFDQCFLEITTVSIFEARDEIDYENIVSFHNPKIVSGDAKLFNKETMTFLEKLTFKASDRNNIEDGRIALYAAGEKRFGTKKLHAMVQCTRFVYMPKLCKVCLDTIVKEYFPKCCNRMQGGRVLGTSCSFRYELYHFLRTNKTE